MLNTVILAARTTTLLCRGPHRSRHHRQTSETLPRCRLGTRCCRRGHQSCESLTTKVQISSRRWEKTVVDPCSMRGQSKAGRLAPLATRHPRRPKSTRREGGGGPRRHLSRPRSRVVPAVASSGGETRGREGGGGGGS
jgi:hypothetical protein